MNIQTADLFQTPGQVVHQMISSRTLSLQGSKNSLAYNNSKWRANPPAATPTMVQILFSRGTQSDLKTILQYQISGIITVYSWLRHTVLNLYMTKASLYILSLSCSLSLYIITESHLKCTEEPHTWLSFH